MICSCWLISHCQGQNKSRAILQNYCQVKIKAGQSSKLLSQNKRQAIHSGSWYELYSCWATSWCKKYARQDKYKRMYTPQQMPLVYTDAFIAAGLFYQRSSAKFNWTTIQVANGLSLFTNEVNPSLAKPPLKFNGCLAKLWFNFLSKIGHV